MRSRRPVLDRRTYRWTDRITKLIAVVAVAVALEAGIASGVGIALVLAGVVLALCTVPIDAREPTTDGTPAAREGETT
ncbi:hypothetical protein [Salinilacihabitans rarus]|uniref:hypothetical protein n=1 Tax=Salinilacihabitans rarus TaxID=2961596 RepID=UPI0020C87A2D|nr:hypothetical protein [Salinilacihabitans rarus]